MDAILQNILAELQIVMKDAEPFMVEVEEWLSSNYSLKKFDPNAIQQSIKSNIASNDDNFDEESIKKQTEAAKAAIDFQKRAGIKPNDMKSLVEKIQSGRGAADPSEFVGNDPDYGDIDMSNEEYVEPLSKKDELAMMRALNPNANSENDVVKEYYEIEKLKKLQRAQPSGKGTFSRGE